MISGRFRNTHSSRGHRLFTVTVTSREGLSPIRLAHHCIVQATLYPP
jgi:hypothetical protein